MSTGTVASSTDLNYYERIVGKKNIDFVISEVSKIAENIDFVFSGVSRTTVPYRTVPYRTVPYRTVPYRTVPYRTAHWQNATSRICHAESWYPVLYKFILSGIICRVLHLDFATYAKKTPM
jgi:hypothetical protein